jgi:site-specific recombinase XerC
MNFDLTTAASGVPALFSPDPSTARRTLKFFTADIRNANTRRAYARAGADFAGWCSERGLTDLSDVEPVHVATYVEQLKLAPPSIKQRLAALRRLFDWLVVGHSPSATDHFVHTGRAVPDQARHLCRLPAEGLECCTVAESWRR